MTLLWASALQAAPYAAMVMDARTGEVLHSRNADAKLHPASLTKMMTLYVTFDAIKRGEITLDTPVTVSRNAANEQPSKLGLRPGQKIALRYLIRATAVKSANDAATAIAEAISGSEAAFTKRMTDTARALGMSKTTFKNAHGLTASGHLSSARDMTNLGRRLLYDYPQYYNLFGRESTNAGVKTVRNTNRRLLQSYRGADGIKTGFTNAAGFNLVASAKRGDKRIIATVFGGTSGAARNARVAELLDMGFSRAPANATVRPPAAVALAGPAVNNNEAGKVIRTSGAVKTSLRPKPRDGSVIPTAPPIEVPKAVIAEAMTPANSVDSSAVDDAVVAAQVASATPAGNVVPQGSDDNLSDIRPKARPASVAPAPVKTAAAPADATPVTPAAQPAQTAQDVVTRLQPDAERHWGINIGRYTSRSQAEKVLLRAALIETGTLDGGLRKVVKTSQGYDATFTGLSRDSADLACRRLQARNVNCFMMGPT
ncbi:D-alanyl-D-alanine carboxypeptidase family protein [Chachezhania antarctica]|uniref:D-alanyl-D-alanine carboxypeptidase family protein n=1 Tax=Chachezhania antarctica TaxID=2340860 RepID=UPI000EABDE0E|nr:D-alanyl-D-alanine carboxypeptidase family protein [Chachezhania antarctica]|tara:strand:+ start:7744 stop:9198 length:1455 start_codon:yes stop_codon:yes gene_type:complete